MQVILLEKIEKLGSLGDVVDVKNGFARNYLLPRGKALRATEAHFEDFEKMRAKVEEKDKERKDSASVLRAKIDNSSFIFISQSGDDGRLYGSISPKDIAERIEKDCKESVPSSSVKLQSKIKDLGIYRICIELHPEVSAFVDINIARSEEEAKVAFDTKAKQELAAVEKDRKLRDASSSSAADAPVAAASTIEGSGAENVEENTSDTSSMSPSKKKGIKQNLELASSKLIDSSNKA